MAEVAEQVADVSTTVEGAPSEELAVADWKDQLPEDLRDHSALAPIQDVGNLAKSFVNAQSMIGKDKIALPGQHSSPEEWNEVYTRLGRPEDPDGYQLELPDDSSEELVGWYKKAAHDLGLNNIQAQKLAESYTTMLEEHMEANAPADYDALQAEHVVALKKEWGAKYDDNIALADTVLSNFWPGSLETPMADGMRLGDNKDFIAAFAAVGEFIRDKISEDQFEGLAKTGEAMAPAEVDDELLEIERPGSPLYDAAHPQHREYVARRDRLYKMKFPEAE